MKNKKKKRRKIRFKKGQIVFVLCEDEIKKYPVRTDWHEDDTMIIIQPESEDEGSFWIEAWQVGATEEELKKNIQIYADDTIKKLSQSIEAMKKFKKKFK